MANRRAPSGTSSTKRTGRFSSKSSHTREGEGITHREVLSAQSATLRIARCSSRSRSTARQKASRVIISSRYAIILSRVSSEVDTVAGRSIVDLDQAIRGIPPENERGPTPSGPCSPLQIYENRGTCVGFERHIRHSFGHLDHDQAGDHQR